VKWPLIAAVAVASSSPAAQGSTGPAACPGTSGAGVALARLGTAQPHLLLDEDFPDPFIARFGGATYAYATGVGGKNVQAIRSAGFTRWSAAAEALPAANLPRWVDRNLPQVWAPEVMQIGGRYLLYFNARHASLTRKEPDAVRQRQCLGVAVGTRPQGPFRGIDAPLVCSEFAEGAIDAHVFKEGGQLYLYYKHDSNCCSERSAIYAQGLSSDGLATIGQPVQLIANMDSPGKQDDWEWRVVEAPTMVKRGGGYFLFYSGNFFGNKNYSVAYLKCASPLGPCDDPGENPILWSHKETTLIGPGHQALLEHGGRSYVFFHGWNRDPDGKLGPEHKRCLYVSQVKWQRDTRDGGLMPIIAGGEPKVMPED
jgi:GH43 family beta-xylosidase